MRWNWWFWGWHFWRIFVECWYLIGKSTKKCLLACFPFYKNTLTNTCIAFFIVFFYVCHSSTFYITTLVGNSCQCAVLYYFFICYYSDIFPYLRLQNYKWRSFITNKLIDRNQKWFLFHSDFKKFYFVVECWQLSKLHLHRYC